MAVDGVVRMVFFFVYCPGQQELPNAKLDWLPHVLGLVGGGCGFRSLLDVVQREYQSIQSSCCAFLFCFCSALAASLFTGRLAIPGQLIMIRHIKCLV